MSAPNRWTTHATFIEYGGFCGRAHRGRTDLAESSGRPVHRSRLDLAAKAGILDRELLDAGKQDPVEMLLAPEVLLAVLEEPPCQRKQHFLLRKQDHASDGGGPVCREGQVRLQSPVNVAVDELGQQRRVHIAAVDGAGELRV